MVGLTILGSTGSIGRSTLDVVARHPDRFEVFALGARRNFEDLLTQCRHHRPRYAVMAESEAAAELRARIGDEGLATEVLGGEEALNEVAADPGVDAVMAGIVGAAGLRSTLAAARAGKRVLLANKEALVVAGPLLMSAVRESGATLLPIDSEHNALFQCMPDGYRPGRRPDGVRRLVLTASGGPFRDWPASRLETATPDEACAHPNWDMGRKISVDSATMMNKGLEVIEACWLFDMPSEEVEVVVHPQSVIHSLVDYEDGSMLAQLGRPDMRTPIAHALAWPARATAGVRPLDLVEVGRLDFERPDTGRFPCLDLAFRAVRGGGAMPAVLNAANEVAVAAFLDERIGFQGIPEAIEAMMERFRDSGDESLDGLMALDRAVRDETRAWIADTRHKGWGTA